MHTLIVSLNPAVDCEWVVEQFRPVEKNEVHSERRWPGGKGINVARWLRWAGGKPHLFVPVGGNPGRELVEGMAREHLAVTTFPLREPTRVNVIVTQRHGGPQYRLNPLWPRFSSTEQRDVVRAVKAAMEKAERVVLSGALPRTLPKDTYAKILRHARKLGKPVVLDCDGEAFRLAVPERPLLVKPNEVELAEWAGRNLETIDEITAAAQALSRASQGWVLVSLGARGALLVHDQEKFHHMEPATEVTVRNTVGAGDALLAAVLLAMGRGLPPVEWLKHGVATGTAATQVPPGHLPSKSGAVTQPGRGGRNGRRQ
jgi:1-phosphofructokinase family hexose kinase